MTSTFPFASLRSIRRPINSVTLPSQSSQFVVLILWFFLSSSRRCLRCWCCCCRWASIATSPPHQPTAAECSLVAGCWSYYSSVGRTHLRLPSQLSTRVPVETTAASLWRSYTWAMSFFVFHCFGYFAHLSSHHWRYLLLPCCGLSLERLARSSSLFNVSGAVQEDIKDGTVHTSYTD